MSPGGAEHPQEDRDVPDAGPVAVPAQRWHPWVRALHWLGVLLVLAVASIGLVMVDLERGSDLRKVCYALHKSLGITALALAALRLLLRLATRAPAPLPAPPWQQRLAQASHALLYVLLVAIPLSGWQPREALRQQLQQQGWEVQRIKVDDGCYEARGIDKNGNAFKAKFAPASLRIRKLEITFDGNGVAADYLDKIPTRKAK